MDEAWMRMHAYPKAAKRFLCEASTYLFTVSHLSVYLTRLFFPNYFTLFCFFFIIIIFFFLFQPMSVEYEFRDRSPFEDNLLNLIVPRS